MEKAECPRCGFVSWQVFRRGKKLFKLNPGDIIVCRNCGAILIINEDHSEREPTTEEFRKMRSDPDTWGKVVRGMADAIKFLKKGLKEEG